MKIASKIIVALIGLHGLHGYSAIAEPDIDKFIGQWQYVPSGKFDGHYVLKYLTMKIEMANSNQGDEKGAIEICGYPLLNQQQEKHFVILYKPAEGQIEKHLTTERLTSQCDLDRMPISLLFTPCESDKSNICGGVFFDPGDHEDIKGNDASWTGSIDETGAYLTFELDIFPVRVVWRKRH